MKVPLLTLDDLDKFNVIPNCVIFSIGQYHVPKETFDAFFTNYIEVHYRDLKEGVDCNIPLLSVHILNDGVKQYVYLYVTYWDGECYHTDMLNAPEVTIAMLAALGGVKDKTAINAIALNITNQARKISKQEYKRYHRPNETYRGWRTVDHLKMLYCILDLEWNRVVPGWDVAVYQKLQQSLGVGPVELMISQAAFGNHHGVLDKLYGIPYETEQHPNPQMR